MLEHAASSDMLKVNAVSCLHSSLATGELLSRGMARALDILGSIPAVVGRTLGAVHLGMLEDCKFYLCGAD